MTKDQRDRFLTEAWGSGLLRTDCTPEEIDILLSSGYAQRWAFADACSRFGRALAASLGINRMCDWLSARLRETR